ENITIRNNTVEVTGNGGSSVSALYIHAWHPSIQITDNTFTSRYGNRSAVSASYDSAPSSAIFINRVGEDVDTADPVISDNTLDSDMYSFFFNAMTNVGTVGSGAGGIEALRNNNFATAATTWALDSGEQDSVSKKLFNALLKNNTTITTNANLGLGYVSLIASGFFNLEQYEISNRTITAISVRGKHIVSDQYAGDSAKNGFENSGSSGIDYGRLSITNGTAGAITADHSDHHFCLGINSGGGGYEYDNDFTPPSNM
ncbi:MAG: hypothetical protein LBG25_06220, partial [Spirochaetaceae bacterium]|nr:hypothetical protein [Spirochaetaceae bacterium]